MSGYINALYENNMRSSGENLATAIVPLMKLLSLTIIGLILAHPKTQIIPKATFKLLSKLVFALFLPCLIFTELGESITLENFVLWWFIPVNVLVSTIIGFFLGLLVVAICQPPPQFNRFTIIMTAFGNTGNLSLAIVGSVCHTKDSPFGAHCHSRGVAYVSFAQWVAVILVYTLVYHMMEPPLEYYEIVEEGFEIEEQQPTPDVSRPLLVEAEWPGMRIKRLNMPRLLSLLGFLIASQAFHKPIFLTLSLLEIVLQTVLGPLDSLEILAGAMVPSVMLILGGMLAEGPNESTLGLRTTIGMSVARLLVLPLLGIGVVALADKLNFLVQGDAMYRFVLLLQYTTPSAILLGAIASLRGYAVKEASALLFWQHVFALFSLSLYIVIYFKLLSYI
ncbi:hypothetical protein GH714_017596 [Hevea brasiliensis]|uniref:Uncharacterized protein n=1 Tax=Hevea brasiliensis TaxID=3981 RepID=A0A6A6MEC4_HEVBR|nr:hypothetical protein GH714_017596 [Hevea brasiliensis]